MAKRPFSTPGNVYPHFNEMTSEAELYSSAPQSPQHNGTNSYETASEMSVYQSALDVNDVTRVASSVPNEDGSMSRPLPPFGRPSSIIPLVEETSQRTSSTLQSAPNTDLFFRNGRQRIDFVLVYAKAEGSREEKNAEARKTFEDNLISEGLDLEYEVEEGRQFNFVKIHAPWDVLARYADIMKFKMPMRRLEKFTRILQVDDDANPIGLTLAFSHTSMFSNPSIAEFGSSVTRENEPQLKNDVFDRLCQTCLPNPIKFPRKPKRVKAEFTRDKEFLFDIPTNKEDFFSTSQRSRIVDFILKRKRFTNNFENLFAFGITRLLTDEVYTAAYPLHEGNYDASDMQSLLRSEWASLSTIHKYQPLDAIKEYFGVRIGLYFAWLGFYTYMLIPASIVGLVCFLYGCLTIYTFVPSKDICGSNKTFIMCPVCDHCEFWKVEESCIHSRIMSVVDNPAIVAFAAFMSFWGALFLELWKRYSATITYQWDLTVFDQSEEHPRPEYLVRFQHVTKKQTLNRVTGTMEPYISFWRRKFPAAVVSVSVVLLLVSIAFAGVIGVIFYRMSFSAALSIQYDSHDANGVINRNVPVITTMTAACINLVCIMILNRIYARVAAYLTELELPRTQTEYDDSLTLKMFSLQFVNYYASIFYIAFFKGKLIGYPGKYERLFGYRQEECGPGGCLMELGIQLAIIMVGKQILNGFMEMSIPFFYYWLNIFRNKFRPDHSPEKIVPSWERDFHLVEMGSLGLFWEYLEMVLQFGFVTIFVAAFPLAPIFALMNNVLEMKLDAKKFLNLYRRPVSQRIRSIGVWYRIMDCIGKIAVVTNAFIIAFTSNFIPSLVYRVTVSADGSLDGYLNFSLSYFSVDDFETNYLPKESELSLNLTHCRYNDFRKPPWSDDKYEESSFFWYLLGARLAFVVVFENVVMLVITFLHWLVPDIPKHIAEKLRRDAYLTNEIIMEHEYVRAKRSSAEGETKRRRNAGTMVRDEDLCRSNRDVDPPSHSKPVVTESIV